MDFLLDLELVVDVFFYVDVILQFFHGYVDLGFPVLDLRKVPRLFGAVGSCAPQSCCCCVSGDL